LREQVVCVYGSYHTLKKLLPDKIADILQNMDYVEKKKNNSDNILICDI